MYRRMEAVCRLEKLINLSIGSETHVINDVFPGYNEQLQRIKKMIKEFSEKNGGFIKMSELFGLFKIKNKSILLICSDEKISLPQSKDPSVFILHTKDNKELFAVCYVDGDNIYIINSCSNTEWQFEDGYQVHNIPMPIKKTKNNSTTNAAISVLNFQNVKYFVDIYRDSNLNQNEVEDLIRLKKEIKLLVALKISLEDYVIFDDPIKNRKDLYNQLKNIEEEFFLEGRFTEEIMEYIDNKGILRTIEKIKEMIEERDTQYEDILLEQEELEETVKNTEEYLSIEDLYNSSCRDFKEQENSKTTKSETKNNKKTSREIYVEKDSDSESDLIIETTELPKTNETKKIGAAERT